MEHSDILGLDSKRHVKMWLLHKRGLSRRQIADLLGGTNPGAVGNELKKYEKDPNRQWAAGNYLGAVVTVKDSGRDDMGDFIKSFAKDPTKQVNKGAAKKSGADSGFKVKLVLADDGRKKGGKWIKKIVAVRAGRDILVGHLKKDSEWYSPNERSRVSTHVRTVYKWGWDAAGLKELFGFDVKPVYRFSRLRHDGRTINDGESTSGAPAAIRFKEILEEKMKEFAAEETPSALEKGAAVEAEHSGLYDQLAARLKEKGVAMPMSREEFFKEIAREHLAEKKDYYDLLEKYVEKHTPAKPAVLDYYSFENQKIDLFNSSFEKSGASGRAKKEEEAINKTFGSGAYEKFQAFRSQYLGRFTSSALMSEDGPDYYKNADEHAWYEILGHYYKQYKDSLHAHSEKHTPAKPNKNFSVEIEFSSSVESQLRTAILSYLPQLVKSIAEKTPDASEKINVDVRKEGSLMHHITEYFVEITPLYGLWARLGFAANRGARGSGGYTKVVAGASVYKRGGSDVEYLDLTYYEEPDYEAEDTKGNREVYEKNKSQKYRGMDEDRGLLSYLLNWAAARIPASGKSMGHGGKTDGNGTGADGGGLLVGVKHTPSGAGINVQTPEGKLKVEGGEIIINAAASKKYCKELSEMNQSVGDGVAFPCDHPALDGVQGPMAGNGAKTGGPFYVVFDLGDGIQTEEYETRAAANAARREIIAEMRRELPEDREMMKPYVISQAEYDADEMAGKGAQLPVAEWTMPDAKTYIYAESIRKNHPEIWRAGGNEFGNTAYENLTRVLKRGYWLKEEEKMYKRWRSFIARHQHDKRLPGVVANLKWLNYPNIGEAAVRELIDDAIKFSSKKPELNGNGGQVREKMMAEYDALVAEVARANDTQQRLRNADGNSMAYRAARMRYMKLNAKRLALLQKIKGLAGHGRQLSDRNDGDFKIDDLVILRNRPGAIVRITIGADGTRYYYVKYVEYGEVTGSSGNLKSSLRKPNSAELKEYSKQFSKLAEMAKSYHPASQRIDDQRKTAGHGHQLSNRIADGKKPYYLLSREEVIAERDALEANWENRTPADEQRMKNLQRYSFVAFKTLLSELK